MTDDDFAMLMEAKARLEEAERREPLSSRIRQLHTMGFRLICRFRGVLGLSDEQFDQLATPQGGGTPKTPPGEE